MAPDFHRSVRRRALDREGAEALAVAAFGALAEDPERLAAFLGATGLTPASLRSAVAAPGFFAGLLDVVAGDEALLVAIASALGEPPERLMEARERLSPPPGDG